MASKVIKKEDVKVEETPVVVERESMLEGLLTKHKVPALLIIGVGFITTIIILLGIFAVAPGLWKHAEDITSNYLKDSKGLIFNIIPMANYIKLTAVALIGSALGLIVGLVFIFVRPLLVLVKEVMTRFNKGRKVIVDETVKVVTDAAETLKVKEIVEETVKIGTNVVTTVDTVAKKATKKKSSKKEVKNVLDDASFGNLNFGTPKVEPKVEEPKKEVKVKPTKVAKVEETPAVEINKDELTDAELDALLSRE